MFKKKKRGKKQEKNPHPTQQQKTTPRTSVNSNKPLLEENYL